MKHLLNNITEEEKITIRKQHTGGIVVNTEKFRKLTETKSGDVRPLLSEDNQGGGVGAAVDPNTGKKMGTGYYKQNVLDNFKQSFNFDNSKMKTGSDDIDITSSEYTKLVNQLKLIMKNNKIKGPINISVTGGASNVGSSSGYNNQALAERRANKLITLLKKDIPNLNSKFNFTVKGVVGNSNKANSPEALAQQFVKVNFDYDEISSIKQSIEIDNTAVDPYKPRVDDILGNVVPKAGSSKKVCLVIPDSLMAEFKGNISNFKKKHGLTSVSFQVSNL